MCCRFEVHSTLDKVALWAMLDLSGFEQVSEAKWVRKFPPRDGVERHVACYYYALNVSGKPDHITFGINPSIGGHSIDEHRTSAIEACFILQLMTIIQERSLIGLPILQTSLVADCLHDAGRSPVLLTTSPRRMMQEDLCLGFRTVLQDGIALVYDV